MPATAAVVVADKVFPCPCWLTLAPAAEAVVGPWWGSSRAISLGWVAARRSQIRGTTRPESTKADDVEAVGGITSVVDTSPPGLRFLPNLISLITINGSCAPSCV